MHEVMTPSLSATYRKSALTLALLEDSGWYKANYSLADALFWGRGLGCDFAKDKCIDASETPQEGFCTDDSPAYGCTLDHHTKGYCNVVTGAVGSDVPSNMQYFADSSNPFTSMDLDLADHCPHYRGFANGRCDISTNAPAHNFRAESYGADGRCFSSTVSQYVTTTIGGKYATYYTTSSQYQACHRTRCNADNTFEFQVLDSEGTETWLACPSDGATVTLPNGFNSGGGGLKESGGSVTCPLISSILCDPHACPGMACDGTDDCKAGMCVCGDEFGTACLHWESPVPAAPPSPAIPGSMYVTFVRFEAVIDATVSSFAQEDYKESLAAFLSVSAEDIALNVTAASVRVVATIRSAGKEAAAAMIESISSASLASLSHVLGVSVESFSPPTSYTLVVANLRPPPPDEHSEPDATLGVLRLWISVGVGMGVCLCLSVAVGFRLFGRRRTAGSASSCLDPFAKCWCWRQQKSLPQLARV